MIQEGYIFKNSLIHRMNPSLKMISVIIFIVLIFIPFGFLFQIILLIVIFSLYFLSKLPLRGLWKILISIFFMALILGMINWISYKTPGFIFDLDNSFNLIKNPIWLNESNPNVVMLDGKWFVHGDIWGGKIEKDLNIMLEEILLKYPGVTLGDYGNGFYIINGIDGTNINLVQDSIWKLNNIVIEFSQFQSGEPLYLFAYSIEWYSLSSFALTLMAYITIKIFSMILIISILTSTTSSIEMTYALEDMLSPLKYLKAPVSEWSMTIALSIRFIPSLLEESNRVLKAQASRGVDFKNGNFIDKMKSLSSLVVPLFSIAFRKADELSNAMEARGYNPRNIRTRYRVFKIGAFDWILFGFVFFYLGLTLTLIYINNKPMLITPLGVFDAIIILS